MLEQVDEHRGLEGRHPGAPPATARREPNAATLDHRRDRARAPRRSHHVHSPARKPRLRARRHGRRRHRSPRYRCASRPARLTRRSSSDGCASNASRRARALNREASSANECVSSHRRARAGWCFAPIAAASFRAPDARSSTDHAIAGERRRPRPGCRRPRRSTARRSSHHAFPRLIASISPDAAMSRTARSSTPSSSAASLTLIAPAEIHVNEILPQTVEFCPRHQATARNGS